MPKSDLELWLETDQAKTAIRAGRKLGVIAERVGRSIPRELTQYLLSPDEHRAWIAMLTLMSRLSTQEQN